MASFSNDGLQVAEYVYDFAVDGGTEAVPIILSDKDTKVPIPTGAIVKAVTMKVVTAFTSGGSATLEWGNGDDQNGYSGTAIAVASLVDNLLVNGWDSAAALIWDDTNDHQIPLNISTALDGEFSILINTAAMTAGKAVFLVEYLKPTLE